MKIEFPDISQELYDQTYKLNLVGHKNNCKVFNISKLKNYITSDQIK